MLLNANALKLRVAMSLFVDVYDAVKKIPKGKVATYGQIAAFIGKPRAARIVGWALHQNPSPQTIPCHRVVNRFGNLSPSFAFGGIEEHKRRLEEEGVKVENYCVDLEKYGI